MSNIHETINNAQEKAWSSVNCIDDEYVIDSRGSNVKIFMKLTVYSLERILVRYIHFLVRNQLIS